MPFKQSCARFYTPRQAYRKFHILFTRLTSEIFPLFCYYIADLMSIEFCLKDFICVLLVLRMFLSLMTMKLIQLRRERSWAHTGLMCKRGLAQIGFAEMFRKIFLIQYTPMFLY